MKVRFEKGGAVFEYERKPMKEHRFRCVCLLTAAAIYAGMVAAVAAMCGIPGLGAVLLATFFLVLVVAM